MKNIFNIFLIVSSWHVVSLDAAAAAGQEQSLFDVLSFSASRTKIRPLTLADKEQVLAVEESYDDFVHIIDDEHCDGKLSFYYECSQQDRVLHAVTTIEQLEGENILGTIYFGIFEKVRDGLLGILKVSGFSSSPRGFLHTSSKYHKDYQSQGYGSEVKTAFFAHLERLRLIPPVANAASSYTPHFLGFKGMVVFENKQALRYNLKCGYKVGLFSGSALMVYYSEVPNRKEEIIDGIHKCTDVSLHTRILPSLNKYLSKDLAESAVGEMELRRESITNMLRFETEETRNQLLSMEASFIAESIGYFPVLFDYIHAIFPDKIPLLRGLVLKYFSDFEEHSKTLGEGQLADPKCQQYIAALKKAMEIMQGFPENAASASASSIEEVTI